MRLEVTCVKARKSVASSTALTLNMYTSKARSLWDSPRCSIASIQRPREMFWNSLQIKKMVWVQKKRKKKSVRCAIK